MAAYKALCKADHDSPELCLGKVRLHIVDAGRCYDNVAFPAWNAVVKREIAWVARFDLVQADVGVVAAEVPTVLGGRSDPISTPAWRSCRPHCNPAAREAS